MITLGIDPGQSGGLALVEDGGFIAGIRMPTIKYRNKMIVDLTRVKQMCYRYRDIAPKSIANVCIEQVNAMPKQGVSSSFQFGRSYGAIEAWAFTLGCKVEHVTPAVWKKHFGLTKSKQASLDMARIKFGDNDLWKVKANDGIAEAALLALYLQNKLG